MSDQDQTDELFQDEQEDVRPDERTLLKERATQMGIKFSPNIGTDTLRERVNATARGETVEPDDSVEGEDETVETEAQKRFRMRKEQTRLVRCRIANLNPSKRDLHGEIFTVGNKYVGTLRKFIPYGEESDNGYHIPFMLYNMLKSKKFLSIKTRRDRTSGEIIIDQKWVPEFALEELPQLTEKELKELATQQAAARGLSE